MEKVITDNNSVASRFFPIKCKSGLHDFYPKQAATARLSFSLVVLTIIASYPRKTGNLHWCGNSKMFLVSWSISFAHTNAAFFYN